MSDFDFERADGLPGPLPRDEQLLWQGQPEWKGLAVHAYHARKVALYFVAITLAQAAVRLVGGASLVEAFAAALWLVPLGTAAVALLTLLAWGSARTTRYSLTSKRIVMRIGIALPVTINIPFKQIDGASLKQTGGGAGDLCFRVAKDNRLAVLLLWPHAKPFRIARPEPCFRGIADVDHVAELAARALGASTPATHAVTLHTPALLAAE
jgi:hypothetical protein